MAPKRSQLAAMKTHYHKADFSELLERNRHWADTVREERPAFFSQLAAGQGPRFLWIGCSDSRVPAEEITGTHTGEIFVHRNIANMVIHTDLNMLSVLEYAVDVLKVEHVIVCGHYGCGGVNAALQTSDLGLLNKWLRHIKEVYRMHHDELNAISTEQDRIDRLVELNTLEQLANLAKTSFVQKAWWQGQSLMLHAWIFDLHSGRLKELGKLDADSPMDPLFRFDFGD